MSGLSGKQKLVVGKAIVQSDITWDEHMVISDILRPGDHNLFGVVREFMGEDMFTEMHKVIKDIFVKMSLKFIRRRSLNYYAC